MHLQLYMSCTCIYVLYVCNTVTLYIAERTGQDRTGACVSTGFHTPKPQRRKSAVASSIGFMERLPSSVRNSILSGPKRHRHKSKTKLLLNHPLPAAAAARSKRVCTDIIDNCPPAKRRKLHTLHRSSRIRSSRKNVISV